MKFKQIILRGSPILFADQGCPRATSSFWVSESYAGREFIPNERGAARKGDEYFDINPDIDIQCNI
jgi:hypothetical protein